MSEARESDGETPLKRGRGRPARKKQRLEPVPNLTLRGGLSAFNRGMITALTHVGLNPTEIAAITYVSRASVYEQLACIEQGQPYGPQATPQSKQTPEHVDARRELVEELHAEDVRRTSNDIRRELFERHDIDVSHRTVVRDQHAMGGRHLTKIIVQKMTPVQMANRLDFAKKHLRLSEGDPFWAKIVFSDETYRGTTDMDQTQWVYDGEERGIVERTRWDTKIHVWGFIGVGLRGLHIITERAVTAETYLDRLRKTVGKAKWRHSRIWQQDNARAHSAKVVGEWFEKMKIPTLPWPANSPDLSPIENLWSRMWREALATHPADGEELGRKVMEVFYSQ